MTGIRSTAFFIPLIAVFCATLSVSLWAAQHSPLLIGIDADMSANASEGGNAIYRGAKIAVDEINQAGGVLGRPLQLVVKDHRGNPARGLKNLKQLSEMDDLVAVLGGVHTPVVLQELDFIHKHKILFLVPWAAGTSIIDNGFSPNYVFRASVRDEEAASIILDEIKRRGLERVALILERTGWGRSNQNSMLRVAQQLGLDIVNISWINWRQSEFTDETIQISASNAQAVVLVTNAPEGAVALSALQYNANTEDLPVVSHWGIAGGNFVEQIGPAVLAKIDLSVLQTFHFSKPSDTAIAKRVLESYKTEFDKSATAYSIPGKVGLAHAYDLVNMLAQAIRSAKSTDSEVIHQALKALPVHQGLVKTYRDPFADSQDALWSEDYILTRYNQEGYLSPSESAND